jgi:hypothetical protein
MEWMSGPRRTPGATVPFEREELAKLKQQTETKVPVLRPAGTAPPNANVVVGRRGNSAHSLVPLPPPSDHDGESEELVIEMSDDEDEAEQPSGPNEPRRRNRSDTLADPMTTSILADSARTAPPAPPSAPGADGPNRHVKRRG